MKIWSDLIHVVEAGIVRVVTFASDAERNQRRHMCQHLLQGAAAKDPSESRTSRLGLTHWLSAC